jgi:hypothetical protein
MKQNCHSYSDESGIGDSLTKDDYSYDDNERQKEEKQRKLMKRGVRKGRKERRENLGREREIALLERERFLSIKNIPQ